MRIQKAQKKHLPAILKKTRQTFQEHKQREPDCFDLDGTGLQSLEAGYKKEFKRRFGIPRNTAKNILVCVEDDNLKGYLYFMPLFPKVSKNQQQYIYINDIATFSPFENQGVATALLNHLKSKGYKSISASVTLPNKASQALFSKEKFHATTRFVFEAK